MAKNIQRAVDLINFYSGKFNTGYFNEEELSRELHVESLNLFEEYMEEYARTKKISDFLRPFRTKSGDVTITNGSGTIPVDVEHPIDVVNKSNGKRIEILEGFEWSERVNDPLFGPEADYGICKLDGQIITVRPTSIATIYFEHFATPTEPLYAVDGNNDYDDANSVAIPWSTVLIDKIIIRVLSKLGITMREDQLIEYSEMKKQQP